MSSDSFFSSTRPRHRGLGISLFALSCAAVYGCSSDGSTLDGGIILINDGAPMGDAAGDGGPGGGVCKPADVATFQPPAYHSANQLGAKYKCTAAQIADFFTTCMSGTANKAACDARYLGTAGNLVDQLCAACILSRDTDPTYGPVITHPSGLVTINVAGCIELKNPGQLSCAKAYQAADACNYAACKDNCTSKDLDQCTKAASENGCKTFTAAAACADDAGADAGIAGCFAGYSFTELYNDVVPVFCLGSGSDGGAPSDAGDSGIADASGGG